MQTNRTVAAAPAMVADFRLAVPEPGLEARVRLWRLHERWIGAATVAGRTLDGIGSTAREALAACLSALGPRAAGALMTDPVLFEVSAVLHRGGHT
jgi:hypothetical protein